MDQQSAGDALALALAVLLLWRKVMIAVGVGYGRGLRCSVIISVLLFFWSFSLGFPLFSILWTISCYSDGPDSLHFVIGQCAAAPVP